MLACCLIAYQWQNLMKIAYGKLGHRGLKGTVVKVNLRKLPISLDVNSFQTVQEAIEGNTEREIFLAYERAVAAGDIIVMCYMPRGSLVSNDFSPLDAYSYSFVTSIAMLDLWRTSSSLQTLLPRGRPRNLWKRTSCVGPDNTLLTGTTDKIAQILQYVSSEPTCRTGLSYFSMPKGTRSSTINECIDKAIKVIAGEFEIHFEQLASSTTRWYDDGVPMAAGLLA